MEAHRRHGTRKKFIRPQLHCFGQMDKIVMQSYSGPARFGGRGRVTEGKAEDFFGS